MLTNNRTERTRVDGARRAVTCASILVAALGLAAILTPHTRADTIVMSNFTTNAEGWNAVALNANGSLNGTVGVSWSASNGNPGGHISRADFGTERILWYFNAPTQFLGDKQQSYGGSLRFDMRQTGTGTFANDSDVRLTGTNGLTLVFDITSNPTNTWGSFNAPLIEGAWRLDSLTGALATQQQMLDVLASLASLRIRGEFWYDGNDTGFLDNVSLNAPDEPVPEPAALALMGTGVAGLALYARRRRRRASRYLARRYAGLAYAPRSAASSWYV